MQKKISSLLSFSYVILLYIFSIHSFPGFAGYGSDPKPEIGGSVNSSTELLDKIKVTQNLGTQLPEELFFTNEWNEKVFLKNYFKSDPVILALVYYKCPSLCGLVMNGIFKTLSEVKLEAGKQYSIVFVSINPKEKPELAAAKRRSFLKSYKTVPDSTGISFLTGEEKQITLLAKQLGIEYVYNEKTEQYAHPGVFMILTPDRKISRYHFGVEYPPKEVQLSLVEASGNKIGSIVDHFILFCYQYDPKTGKYGLAIFRAVQVGAVLTLLGILIFVFFMSRTQRSWKDKNHKQLSVGI